MTRASWSQDWRSRCPTGGSNLWPSLPSLAGVPNFGRGERVHLLAENFTRRKLFQPAVLFQQEIPACVAADLRAACFRSIFLLRSRDGSEKKIGGESCASWIAFLSACCHHNKMIGRVPPTFAIICPASFSLGNIYDCKCASCCIVALRPVLVSGCQ